MQHTTDLNNWKHALFLDWNHKTSIIADSELLYSADFTALPYTFHYSLADVCHALNSYKCQSMHAGQCTDEWS